MYQKQLPLPNPMMLSLGLQSSLNNELNSGETMLWLDQPIASRMSRSAWPLVIFGVFWSLFCVVWMFFSITMALKTKSGQMGWFVWLFPAFGLPFCFIGLGMLTSPIWIRKLAGKTVYVVTDQRAFILSRFMGKTKLRSYKPQQLDDIERTLNDDGSGDLIFEKVTSSHTHTRRNSYSTGARGQRVGGGRSRTRTTSTTTYGFKCVPNAKQVHELIEGMVAAAGVSTQSQD